MNPKAVFDVHGATRRGRENDTNHDHFAIATLNKSMRMHQSNLAIDDDSRVHGHNQGQVFLVADGVGCGADPSHASGAAIDSIVQYFLNEMPWYHLGEGQPDEIVHALEKALQSAQAELLELARRDGTGMDTTMTLAFVFWPELYIAHVGDSRCYLERGGRLRQLTTDHTLARFEGDSAKSPEKSGNVAWNLVGGDGRELHPEVRHVTLEAGDVLALVTDGISHQTTDGELRSILMRTAPAEEVCERLVGAKGPDDRTAIVVRFLPREEHPAEADSNPSPPRLRKHESGPRRKERGPRRVASEHLRRREPPFRRLATA